MIINDIDKTVLTNTSKFVDDTKYGSKVTTEHEFSRSNKTNTFMEWTEKDQIKLIIDKCQVIHIVRPTHENRLVHVRN